MSEQASHASVATPAGLATPTHEALAPGVTPERLAQVLQAAGYRATVAETNGIFEVRSAAQGLSFFARFGNRSGVERQFIDFTLFCPLAINGELASGAVELWNRSRRFARLTREQQLLVLSMDVLAAGGVPDTYLRAQSELWDKILRDLILYLRQSGSPTPAASTPEAAGAATASSPKDAH